MKVHSIGHIVLKVRDLERSVPFYTEVLGMKEVSRNDRPMAFLIFEDNHHDIALVETGSELAGRPGFRPRPRPSCPQGGKHHGGIARSQELARVRTGSRSSASATTR